MAAGLFLVMLYVKHLQTGDAVVLVAVYFIWLKLALTLGSRFVFLLHDSLLAILFTAGLYIVGLYAGAGRNCWWGDGPGDAATEMAFVSSAVRGNFNVMAMAARAGVLGR